MKKKLLSLVFAICLIIPCAICLSACGKDKDDEPPAPVDEPATITITYHTDYGDLSFKSKQLEFTNDYTYLTDSDLPIISNEGDERILDYWATANGDEFDFNTQLNEDIELYATFTESEWVWFTSWDLYDSLYEYRVNFESLLQIKSTGVMNHHSGDSTKQYSPSFKKIKQEECLPNYITKAEYYVLGNETCFITSVEEETIVTDDVLTNKTYAYRQYVNIKTNKSTYIESVVYGYMPKGVAPNSDLALKFAYNYAKQQREFLNLTAYDFSNYGHNLLILTVDEFNELTTESYNELSLSKNYNYIDKDWQEDEYVLVQTFYYIKFAYETSNGDIKYCAFIPTDKYAVGYHLFEDITREEYLSYNISDFYN